MTTLCDILKDFDIALLCWLLRATLLIFLSDTLLLSKTETQHPGFTLGDADSVSRTHLIQVSFSIFGGNP